MVSAPGSAPPLSDFDLIAYLRAAGFTGAALINAAAIVFGESGADPDELGDENLANATWGPSVGLGQVRSLRADYGTGRWRDASRLTDPAFNTRAMFAISGGGTNWRPWSVWTSGKYRRHLSRAWRAVAGTPAGHTPMTLTGQTPGEVLAGELSGPFGVDAGDVVSRVVDPLRRGLARLTLVGVLVAGGVGLVVVGGYQAAGRRR